MVCSWYSIKDKEFMADISPLGRIPVLFDSGAHIYESGASLHINLAAVMARTFPMPCLSEKLGGLHCNGSRCMLRASIRAQAMMQMDHHTWTCPGVVQVPWWSIF